MAREPEEYASKIKYCPGLGETICGSTNVMFKYLNNGKPDQPRYKCLDCKIWFTLGDHRRKKPGHYKKPRNKDPEELQGMRTECSWCGAVNQSRFKYYNNKNTTQPRFKCLGCEKLFQMRLDGKQLVPVKSKLRETKPSKTKPSKTKPSKPKPAKTKTGKRAPPNPRATTSANNDGCGGVVNEAQVGQFSNTQDQTLFDAPDQSVPMQPYDGGQWFSPEDVAQASASLYASQYAYDHSGAFAYECNGVVNVAQVGQFSNTEDQTLNGAPDQSVLMQPYDGGQWFNPEGVAQASGGLYASQTEYENGASSYKWNGVVNVGQVDQFSNTENQTFYGASNSVPMEQFDGGQVFCPQGMEASAGLYACQYEHDYGASAYECNGVVNVGQVDQFTNTVDQTFCGASGSVPMPQGMEASTSLYSSAEECEHGASAFESNGGVNTAQVGQFSNTDSDQTLYGASDSVPMEEFDVGQYINCPQGMEASQTQYVHGVWTNQCNAVNAVQVPVLAAAAIPSDIPNYDTASACEYEEVNADQVEQFSDTDAVPVDHSDVAECPYSAEMVAATAIPFVFPNDNAIIYSEDFEEDLDAVSLWD